MTLLPGMTEESEARYFASMNGQEPLAAVILGAAYVDQQLVRLIDEAMFRPGALKGVKLDYYSRVSLAVALGLKERLHKPLHALGTIRNGFAHDPDAQLTINEINNLYDSFDGEEKTMMNGIYDRMRKQFRHQMPKRLRKAEPLDQFVLMTMSLRSALVAARLNVAGERPDQTSGS